MNLTDLVVLRDVIVLELAVDERLAEHSGHGFVAGQQEANALIELLPTGHIVDAPGLFAEQLRSADRRAAVGAVVLVKDPGKRVA